MDTQFTDHARQRLRENRVAREAVRLTVDQPDGETVLHAGRWNERRHGIRRFGDRELHVVWMRRQCELVVVTVWWRRVRRTRRRERR